MSYYSKVAEVNAAGDLSGDETTQSGTSDSSDDEDGGGLDFTATKEVDDKILSKKLMILPTKPRTMEKRLT